MSYLKKDGTLTETAKRYIIQMSDGKWHKLSKFYSAGSTKYPAVLDSPLFTISTNPKILELTDFPKAKAVIQANFSNKLVAQQVKAYRAQAKAFDKMMAEQKKRAAQGVKSLEKEYKAAQKFIGKHHLLLDKWKDSVRHWTNAGKSTLAQKLGELASSEGQRISQDTFYKVLQKEKWAK